MTEDAIHDKAHADFWDIVTASGLRYEALRVTHAADYPLSMDFLGFLGTYQTLANLIPEDRTIYDFGCAYGLQAAFFLRHHAYIGVDNAANVFFRTPNSTYHEDDIVRALETLPIDKPNFAILNYVPGHDSRVGKAVREAFPDVFAYYPKSRRPSPTLHGFKRVPKEKA